MKSSLVGALRQMCAMGRQIQQHKCWDWCGPTTYALGAAIVKCASDPFDSLVVAFICCLSASRSQKWWLPDSILGFTRGGRVGLRIAIIANY